MEEAERTAEQLLEELDQLRRRVAELEEWVDQHKQAEEEIQRRSEELATLLEASTTIMSSLDLETVLRAVAEQMARIVGVEGCAFFRWHEASQSIHSWVAYGTDLVNVWQLDQPGVVYRLEDQPLMARGVSQLAPAVVHVDDPQTDPAERARLENFGLKSVLMLPVVAYDRVVGLVELMEGRHRHEFSSREIALAQTLVNQAAVAIENARLYSDLQTQMEKLKNTQA